GAAHKSKPLSFQVFLFSECKHRSSISARHLREDVSRGAEAVQADRLRIAALGVAAIPDQARAQERRGVRVVVALGNRHAVAFIGDDLVRVAAVQVAAGEPRPVAKVLAVAAAVRAYAAGPAEPRHAYARAR